MRDPHDTISRVMSFIRGDLTEIALPKDRSPKTCFPAILVCFSGMDFLGALISGKTSNKERIRVFLTKQMASIDERYEWIAADLYDSLRNSLVHCGTMGGYFLVESDESFRAKHLGRVVHRGQKYVVLHTKSFVEHYLQASEAAQGELRNKSAEELEEMLDKILTCPYKEPSERIPMVEPQYPSSESLMHDWMAPPQMPNTPNGTCVEDTPGWPHSSEDKLHPSL